MRSILLCASILTLAACAAPGQEVGPAPATEARMADNPQLLAAVGGEWRSDVHRARDAFRRPYESMRFWGLKPGMTVVEIDPGGEAWWTEILAPYAARTGGRYVAGYVDLGAPNVSDNARKARSDFEAKFADTARFGTVRAVNFGMASGLQLEPGTADIVLVARAFHNWARREGATDRYMGEFFKALKPGGVLAVEQHRAPAGGDVTKTAPTGYVPESYVIEAAERAGFRLAGRSELNANPKDTRDHPFGVWTLPPIRRESQGGRTLTPEERARYDAIGESDRMTLKFVKPA